MQECIPGKGEFARGLSACPGKSPVSVFQEVLMAELLPVNLNPGPVRANPLLYLPDGRRTGFSFVLIRFQKKRKTGGLMLYTTCSTEFRN